MAATLIPNVTGQRDYLQSIVDTVHDPMLVLGKDLRVVSANRAFYRTFGVSPEDTVEVLVYELGSGQWDIPALRLLLEDILPQASVFNNFDVIHEFPGIGLKAMLLNARTLYTPDNHAEMILLAIEDVTERRAVEAALAETALRLQQAYDSLAISYQHEKHIAKALQRPLTLEIAEDSFPGLWVATLFESAHSEAEVGGDFFDAFALPRESVVLAVGDASGKGLAAAARTMQVKDVLRAFAREYPHIPGNIAARLNDYVCDNKRFEQDIDGPESFVCMALAILDPLTGEAAVLSAGAEPPVILRANGECEVIEEVSGMPLGVSPQEVYASTMVQLEPGDTLILLTDGITEARQGSEFLDQSGLIDLARRGRAEATTLREMGLFILDGARTFAGGALHDDACLLLAQRR